MTSRHIHVASLLTMAGVLSSAPAMAADSVLKNFVNFHYIVSEVDSAVFEEDGVESDLGAGFQITSSFSGYGRFVGEIDIRKYEGTSANSQPGADERADLDIQSFSAGVGAGAELFDRFHVLAAVSFDEFRFRVEDQAQSAPMNTVGPSIATDSVDGVGLQIAGSATVIEGLEVYARLKTIQFDVPDGVEDTETAIRGGVRYSPAERLSVIVEYETFDEQAVNDIRVGFGLTFGD